MTTTDAPDLWGILASFTPRAASSRLNDSRPAPTTVNPVRSRAATFFRARCAPASGSAHASEQAASPGGA